MRMLKRFFIGAVIGAVIVAVAAPLAAQNLADVARAEEARRKAVKGQAKVYTNDTLRGADGSEPPAPPQPAAAAVPAAAEKSVPPPGNKPAPPRTTEAAKDEKYWRDRLAGARDALSRSQTFADALQSQINALYTEFVNMDDPIQRSVIEKKRLAAIAEQDRVKADIAKQTKALADIEDEARRANVPAGWLR
jgi:gas vesicle protein